MSTRIRAIWPIAAVPLLASVATAVQGTAQALLVSLDGASTVADPTPIAFDTDLDGQLEEIYAPEIGAGYIARDVDGNGTIDDGGELVGSTTGDPTDELLDFDNDGDGWISEEEAAAAGLVVWSPGEVAQGGDALISFADAGIGLIFPQVVLFDDIAEEGVPYYLDEDFVSAFEVVAPTTFEESSEYLGTRDNHPEGTCSVDRQWYGVYCAIEGQTCMRKGDQGICEQKRNSLLLPYCKCDPQGGGGPVLDGPWAVVMGSLLAGASIVFGFRTSRPSAPTAP